MFLLKSCKEKKVVKNCIQVALKRKYHLSFNNSKMSKNRYWKINEKEFYKQNFNEFFCFFFGLGFFLFNLCKLNVVVKGIFIHFIKAEYKYMSLYKIY